jgi:hypothetical protein
MLIVPVAKIVSGSVPWELLSIRIIVPMEEGHQNAFFALSAAGNALPQEA